VADPYREAGYYYLLKADKTREHGPLESKPLYERALQVLLRSVSIDQAVAASYLALSNRPSPGPAEGDSRAYLLLSVVYSRLGDPGKAYDAVNKARALDPLNPQMYRQLAAVLDLEGHKEDADVASMLDHAITSVQEEKWQEASNLTGRVLQFDPVGYPSAYYLDAMANLHLGNLDLAEKSAREAIRLDSAHRNPRTSYVLGLILAEKKDFKPAAESLKVYLKAWPNAPDGEIVRKQLREIETSARAQTGLP